MDEPQNRHSGNRFPGPALADQPQDLSWRTSKEMPSTARTRPRKVKKCVLRSRDLEQILFAHS